MQNDQSGPSVLLPFLDLMAHRPPAPRIIGPGILHVPEVQRPAFVAPPAVLALLARTLEDCQAERSYSSTTPPLTHAALVLDESLSMARHKAAALTGFNAQVAVVTEGSKEAGETRVTLNVFSTRPRAVLTAAPVLNLKPLGQEEYVPAGNTALYDALGDTIATLLAQPRASDPNAAFLVAAFTDGDENASKRYSAPVLKALIERLEATGRWTFTLMGPEGGALEMASVLNIAVGNVAVFDPTKTESVSSAFGQMAAASTQYMNLRSAGVTASASLYADTSRG